MSREDLEKLLAVFAALEAQVDADPEIADRILIESGIYTEAGELAKEYT